MISLMYVSNTDKNYSEAELEVMLASFCRKNASIGVTGVLIYNGAGTFIQIIEGDEEDIDPLYKKILNDPRHNRINCLRRKKIEDRQFPAWRMGFRNLSKDAIKGHPNFVDFFNDKSLEDFLQKDSNLAFSILTHFKNVTKELIF